MKFYLILPRLYAADAIKGRFVRGGEILAWLPVNGKRQNRARVECSASQIATLLQDCERHCFDPKCQNERRFKISARRALPTLRTAIRFLGGRVRSDASLRNIFGSGPPPRRRNRR